MTVIKKTIGRLPVLIGEYDSTRSYGKKNRVTLFGSEFESKHDNNMTAPATWDGSETVTFNEVDWQVISNGTSAWIAGNDKPAASEDFPYNGMGRIILKKNMVNIAEEGEEPNIVNLLTQSAFEDSDENPLTNTIFVIKYDFTLGEDITIPANCVLEFDGGSISGDSTKYLKGTRTCINAPLTKIFDTSIILKGDWYIKEVYPQWFGAQAYGPNADDSDAIQAAVNFARNGRLFFPKGYYTVTKSIIVNNGIQIDGAGCESSRIRNNVNSYPVFVFQPDYLDAPDWYYGDNDNRELRGWSLTNLMITGFKGIEIVEQSNPLRFIINCRISYCRIQTNSVDGYAIYSNRTDNSGQPSYFFEIHHNVLSRCFLYLGDSNIITHNKFESYNESDAPTLHCNFFGGGGSARNQISYNNMECSGGGILIENALELVIEQNQIENKGNSIQPLIEIRGINVTDSIDSIVIRDNNINGWENCERLIKVCNSTSVIIENNVLYGGATENKIEFFGNCKECIFASTNISYGSYNVVTNGNIIKELWYTPTFVNPTGLETLKVMVDRNNIMYLNGTVYCTPSSDFTTIISSGLPNAGDQQIPLRIKDGNDTKIIDAIIALNHHSNSNTLSLYFPNAIPLSDYQNITWYIVFNGISYRTI